MFSKKNKIVGLLVIAFLLCINTLFKTPAQGYLAMGLMILSLFIYVWILFDGHEENKQIEPITTIEGESFSSLLTQLPLPICIIDKHHDIIFRTQAFDNLLLVEANNVQETNIEMRTILNEALENLQKEQFEVTYIFRFYSLYSIRLNVQQHHLFVFNDTTSLISEQRNTKRFMGDASHELKTPITAIKGISEVLISHQESDLDVIYDFLKQINIESIRLESMVNDMLMISKLSSQISISQETLFNLADLVREVHKTFIKEAENKDMTIQTNQDALMIKTDYSKMKTLLNNLVSNAIRYSESGTVLIDYKIVNNDIVITVQDEGIGIEFQHIPKVFSRFYRVDSDRNRSIGGSGLGLAIVKQIVRDLDGTIDIASKIDVGTVITVTFPKS